MTRAADIQRIYRDLAVISRRARARTASLEPTLTFVEHTLLAHIADGTSRAADLADLFGMDKSTISRQLASLIAAGQLRRGPRQGRDGQALELTDAGRAVLQRATKTQTEVVAARVSSWTAADIATFAALLDRYAGA